MFHTEKASKRIATYETFESGIEPIGAEQKQCDENVDTFQTQNHLQLLLCQKYQSVFSFC